MKLDLKYIFVLIFLLIGINASASRIDRAYDALHKFDYFNARALFTKGLKYDECPAAQGLAIIYYRTDNPFHNKDSALFYIQKSILGWDMYKQRKKEKYAAYGFTEDSLHQTRSLISSSIYKEIKTNEGVEALNDFINTHTWAKELDQAVAFRDSVAFFTAVNKNNAVAYKEFAETYPSSTYTDLALDNFHDTQYEEETQAGNLQSFEKFISDNPSSPLVPEAERNIFYLTTEDHAKQSYIDFINKYNSSSYLDSAWMNLFQLEISEYNEEKLNQFLISYPQNTIQDYVNREALYVDSVYLPYLDSNKYGFMDVQGVIKTAAEYDYVGFYREGLAIVSKKDKYGFIDRFNNVRIPLIYSSASAFKNGRAIVEQNDKIGMIDRNGHLVFDCIYDDLSTVSEGLAYAQLNDKYGYYDTDGTIIIPHNFDDAYDFVKGKAKVEQDEKQGFINKEGKFVVRACHEKIDEYYDTLYTFFQDGFYGIMNHNCQIFVEPKYDYIGSLLKGVAVASIDDRVVYLDTLGRIIIDNGYESYPNFMSKGAFEGETAIIYKDGKYGRINIRNKEITNPKFENIGSGDTYYPGKIKSHWGLFDKNNKAVVSALYHAVQLVDNKYLIASVNDTVAVLDIAGKVIVPSLYEEIELLNENHFLVKQKGKMGVYEDTKLVVPVLYDQIGLFDKDFLFLSRSGVLEYYYIPGQRIIGKKDNE